MVKGLSTFAIKHGIIPIAYAIIRLYFCFIRIQTVNEDRFLHYLRQGGKAIVALWHQRFFLVLTYARRFAEFSPAAMISQSRDGDVIAAVSRQFNFRPVRGSSSRGGREALAAMVEELSVNPFAVHAVDGPQGPRGVIKAGLIRMAQLSGVPIVPITMSVNRAWILNSWDRCLIPKPFSTVVVRWHNPLPVPAILDDGAFEGIRQETEQRMRAIQDEDDRKCGWRESLF